MNPLVFEKTKDGEVLYDIYSRLIKDRIIFIAEVIDTDLATTVSASLLFLNSQSKVKPIDLFINSIGGIIHSGLFTIYDTMNYIDAPVHTTCIGEAYSAAAVLLAAGKKGERRAFPNAHVMIHDIQNIAPEGFSESTTKLKKRSKMTDDLNNKLMNILSKLTGQSDEILQKLLEEETYFSAEEAKEFGLIDRIVADSATKKAKK